MVPLVNRLLRCGCFVVIGLALVGGGVWFWYTHRPVPSDTQQALFEGVTYIRDVRRDPRPLVIHVVVVDLDAPGIALLVTPGDPSDRERPLRAQKTSRFLATSGLQVAVNGDFFTPWYSNTPWDYYPHVGDPVQARGFASSNGVIYSQGQDGAPTLYVSRTNDAALHRPTGEIYSAISGYPMLLQDGQILVRSSSRRYYVEPEPRSAVGLDSSGRSLLLVVVDGRQPNYSEGVTLTELSEILLEYGAHTALNLDGGGSSTLVVEGESDEPQLLNSPIDNRIPGRERPVANHLGVFARR